MPNSPQIVISSKDLQNLANLEPIVQDSKDLNLTIIDIDVYAAQMQQVRESNKEQFELQKSLEEARHRRKIAWVDNIFLKLLNLGMFAAGFYLVIHNYIAISYFLLGGALYPLAGPYVMKFAGTLLGKEGRNEEG